MTRAAVQDFFPPAFPVFVDPIEVDNGPSIPTAYLMDRLSDRYRSTHSVHFVMGSDLINSLDKWDDGERIINEMPVIVFKRKGTTNQEAAALERHRNFPKNKPILVGEDKSLIGVISSTEVRKRVRENNQL